METHRHRLPRPAVAFLHDTAMAALSFVIALALRRGETALAYLGDHLLPTWALFVAASAVAFMVTGLYRGLWRYASMNDLVAILKAATLAILLFMVAAFIMTRLQGLPRTSFVINWFVLIFLLGGPRMLYRVFKDRSLGHLLERDMHLRAPVILIGASDAAEVFVREMARDRDAPYEVLGIIDEKGTRIGRDIHGVPVAGHLGDLKAVVARLARHGRRPQRIVISKPLEREDMERVLQAAETLGCSVASLPRLADFSAGDLRAGEIRPVAIEDILGRPQQPLDQAAMRSLIEGRRVLISGAGGSIGSELARQVATFRPAHLSLIDVSESLLYAIDLEISERAPGLSRLALLADVRDAGRLERVFARETPDLVLHAAALKHVPIVEAQPIEGLLTNVIGTRNVAQACRKQGVAAMVQISTDKAVNPPNVMGASKRLAEMICQALDVEERKSGGKRGGTRFLTVRFGNVLGSTGSVVQLFQRQLARGGPLTVTHPEMTRYFMTVREAVQLILQAAALGETGSGEDPGAIFVLEMGEPVRITDLAHQMIRLAGRAPGEEVAVEIIGPRPGEKLHEELFHQDEALRPTGHAAVKVAAPRAANALLLEKQVAELEALARDGRREEALDLLARLVPEYQRTRPESQSPAAVS